MQLNAVHLAVSSEFIIALHFVHVHVGSVVEWLTHRTDDQHGLGSKPTCALLLCPWERHFPLLGGLDKQF